ncbi:unnamed protein product [Calypogeia fissa]
MCPFDAPMFQVWKRTIRCLIQSDRIKALGRARVFWEKLGKLDSQSARGDSFPVRIAGARDCEKAHGDG